MRFLPATDCWPLASANQLAIATNQTHDGRNGIQIDAHDNSHRPECDQVCLRPCACVCAFLFCFCSVHRKRGVKFNTFRKSRLFRTDWLILFMLPRIHDDVDQRMSDVNKPSGSVLLAAVRSRMCREFSMRHAWGEMYVASVGHEQTHANRQRERDWETFNNCR